MSHADVNGQRLFYEDSGGDGPVVLFSHGYLMDHTMFDPQVDALAPEFRCVRWDERGFGATEEDGKPFTYWDAADDAVGLLDRLGIDDAVFAGMSQGGFLSIRAALAHPERVRALVLIDTSADVDDPETLGAYQGMEDAWASPDTPDADHQALREAIGGLIIGDPEVAAPWVEAWGKERRDRTLEPFATLVSARRHHQPARRDHLPGARRPRDRRRRHPLRAEPRPWPTASPTAAGSSPSMGPPTRPT